MSPHQASAIERALSRSHDAVRIGAVVHNVSSVDVAQGTFAASVTLLCKWHDASMARDVDVVSLHRLGATIPKLANGAAMPRMASGHWPEEVLKEIDPDLVDTSRPKLALANAVSAVAVDGSLACYLSPNDPPGTVRAEQRFLGAFQCAMDMSRFPFDSPTLEIVVTFEQPSARVHRTFVQLTTPGGAPMLAASDAVDDLPGWTLAKAPRVEAGRDPYPYYAVRLQLERVRGPHVWMGLGIPSATSLLGIITFAVASPVVDGASARTSFVAVLMLLLVASRQFIVASVPSSTESTLLDVHTAANLILVLLTAWVGALGGTSTTSEEAGGLYVSVPIALLLCAWGFVHAWLVANVLKLPAGKNRTASVYARFAASLALCCECVTRGCRSSSDLAIELRHIIWSSYGSGAMHDYTTIPGMTPKGTPKGTPMPTPKGTPKGAAFAKVAPARSPMKGSRGMEALRVVAGRGGRQGALQA